MDSSNRSRRKNGRAGSPRERTLAVVHSEPPPSADVFETDDALYVEVAARDFHRSLHIDVRPESPLPSRRSGRPHTPFGVHPDATPC